MRLEFRAELLGGCLTLGLVQILVWKEGEREGEREAQ